MKKNAKIIQISGFRGILTAIFVVVCLAAGFIVFPGYVAMNIWNHFSNVLPQINLMQGVLLWAIVALSCYIANKQKFAISFASPQELSDEEMEDLMERVRMQSQARLLNQMITKSIEESQKDQFLKKEEEQEQKEVNNK